jgi:hypothetical protein
MSFWYWVESSDDCGNDLFTIKVNGTSIYDQDLCVNENSSNWERKILDLSTYTNSTIELLFEVTTNETSLNDPYGSSLYLDDISLQ